MARLVLAPLLTASFMLAPSLAAADSAVEHRTASATLVSGPASPTPEAFLRAHVLAGAAERLAPFEPWGQAAHCDLARRWGDPPLTAACVATLAARAPGHPETTRALDLAARAHGPGSLVLGWALLGLFLAATLWRHRRRQEAGRRAPLPTAAILLGLLPAALAPVLPAHAAPSSPAPLPIVIDDRAPERTVPTPAQRDANPIEFGYHLQELIARAESATQRQDHAAAARYYRALARAVPDRATAFGKLCTALEAAGDRPGARAACLTATGLPGVTVADFAGLVRLTLARSGTLTSTEVSEARSATQHLAAQPGAEVTAHLLACELALRLRDVAGLGQCTQELGRLAPGDTRTLSFQWAVAVEQKDGERARSLIAQAEKSGMAAPGIARMKQGTEALLGNSSPWRRLLDWRLAAVLLLLAAALITLLRARRPLPS